MLFTLKMLHVLALFALLLSSFRKNLLLRPWQISNASAQALRRWDKLSAAAAGVALLTGLAMLFGYAKPTSYYTAQPMFWLKMALFFSASAWIIATKMFFRKAAAASQPAAVPTHVRWALRYDFVGLVLMAAIGYALAHGLKWGLA